MIYMQNLIFPMEYMRITQGENGKTSHLGSLALDLGGKDTGRDTAFAPCDLEIIRIRKNRNGEVYLQSTDKVKLADGTEDYVHLLFLHTENFNYSVGDIIRQGAPFYTEGGMGHGKPGYFGSHIHVEGGKGKWKNAVQYQNKNKTWVSENQRHLYNLFFVDPDKTKILNDGGYKWVALPKQKSLTTFSAAMSSGDLKQFTRLAEKLQIKYNLT